MTSNPAMITAADTVVQPAQLMRTRDVGIQPVVASHGDHRLVGILTDRDIVVRFVAPGHASAALVRKQLDARSDRDGDRHRHRARDQREDDALVGAPVVGGR